MEIDGTDQQILALLSKNARITHKEIAGAVGLSPSSAHERTRRLFDPGLVTGARAEVALERLRLSLRAHLFVLLAEHEKTNLDRFVTDALQLAEVRAAWMITGHFDAVVELVTRDTSHLHRVVVEKFSSRAEIHRIETSIIFDGGRRMDISATLELVE